MLLRSRFLRRRAFRVLCCAVRCAWGGGGGLCGWGWQMSVYALEPYPAAYRLRVGRSQKKTATRVAIAGRAWVWAAIGSKPMAQWQRRPEAHISKHKQRLEM